MIMCARVYVCVRVIDLNLIFLGVSS